MKINSCMISLILIAVVAILLLLNQPSWMRSGYSDGKEMMEGTEHDEGKEMMEGTEHDEGMKKEMYCGGCGM